MAATALAVKPNAKMPAPKAHQIEQLANFDPGESMSNQPKETSVTITFTDQDVVLKAAEKAARLIGLPASEVASLIHLMFYYHVRRGMDAVAEEDD